MLKVRRALISVWDKKGIVEFARKLASLKIDIVSTGKTASLLKKSRVEVREVSSITSFPEILSGRVKTLHPKIFGGILANKKHPLHMEEIRNLEIPPIDMIVVNLYPFSHKLEDKLSWSEMMEYIDIGGQALLRAGAKNFRNVACISSPAQYKLVIEELIKNNGFISDDTLKKLAVEVFYLTKEYDTVIYQYFKGKKTLSWNLEKISSLRYGENPHQKGGLYSLVNLDNVKFFQIQGKALSFNNYLDLDTALACAKEFIEPSAVIVKHTSVCGVGVNKKLSAAFRKAYMTDPVSSFGGIVGLSRKVDRDTANNILKSGFKECIIAPSYSKEALRLFSLKSNLRVLETDFFNTSLAKERIGKEARSTLFGYLIQNRDTLTLDRGKMEIVTKRKPTPRELRDLILAWKVVKYVKSNGIVVAKNSAILGVGGGQPSRIGAVKQACNDAVKSCQGAVLASDGFFPKDDSIKFAQRKGIRAIIQPGGSIKDKDIIACCNKFGIAMVFTRIRHFRH